jgi:hypothetical protein
VSERPPSPLSSPIPLVFCLRIDLLRTRSPSSVETIARKPSHSSSKDHPEPQGSGLGRESIGSGSRRDVTLRATSPRLDLCASGYENPALLREGRENAWMDHRD